MEMFDRVLEVFITVVMIVGGYQFYFWAQRQTFRPARLFDMACDSWLAFDARWVWVYSGLYYPMILLAAMSVPTWQEFAYTCGCFLSLLAVQVAFFITWPVAIPAHWRAVDRYKHPRSMRMLDLVWSYDKLRNSLPSMHVSVAMMVDLTIGRNWPGTGLVFAAFPLLIAISALKTKQHYVIDVVPGALLGAAVFFAWHALIG